MERWQAEGLAGVLVILPGWRRICTKQMTRTPGATPRFQVIVQLRDSCTGGIYKLSIHNHVVIREDNCCRT